MHIYHLFFFHDRRRFVKIQRICFIIVELKHLSFECLSADRRDRLFYDRAYHDHRLFIMFCRACHDHRDHLFYDRAYHDHRDYLLSACHDRRDRLFYDRAYHDHRVYLFLTVLIMIIMIIMTTIYIFFTKF